ncbi:hypothetical protein B5M09_007910 [Aphanomyces astaci]|uniref:Uncharacterized protein n=1 Tax=Aphanomyces astaci TaxID=112090 RepID=A0A3R8DJR2_APHAT|nr:hypothetical protein B5M09_007910 [Aphanomyces astaci]
MLGDRKPKPLGENADWAKKNKALIVSMEHRFYGKLQPLPDFSTESLKFLCAEQVPILKDSSRAVLEADLYYPFEGLAQANDYSSYGLMAACADFKAEGKSPLEKAVAFCTSLKWATVSATTKPTLSTPM